jgi:hypothetical protein
MLRKLLPMHGQSAGLCHGFTHNEKCEGQYIIDNKQDNYPSLIMVVINTNTCTGSYTNNICAHYLSQLSHNTNSNHVYRNVSIHKVHVAGCALCHHLTFTTIKSVLCLSFSSQSIGLVRRTEHQQITPSTYSNL